MIIGNDVYNVYVETETAKLAVKKGFDPRVLRIAGAFYKDGVGHVLQSVLQKYLRLRHLIHVEATMYVTEKEGLYAYKYEVKDTDNYKVNIMITYDNYPSYEKALENGLVAALNLLKDE